LIWKSGTNEDTFKVDKNGTLISSSTINALKRILDYDSENIYWSDYAEINFDKFWIALENLRINRASDIKTCKILLDGWNFIEDMGRTFKLSEEMKRLKSHILCNAYDKIFWGNNLPAVTPEGNYYSPLWSTEEISSLRNEFKYIWKIFTSLNYIKY